MQLRSFEFLLLVLSQFSLSLIEGLLHLYHTNLPQKKNQPMDVVTRAFSPHTREVKAGGSHYLVFVLPL